MDRARKIEEINGARHVTSERERLSSGLLRTVYLPLPHDWMESRLSKHILTSVSNKSSCRKIWNIFKKKMAEAQAYMYVFIAALYALVFIVIGSYMVMRGRRRKELEETQRANAKDEAIRYAKRNNSCFPENLLEIN